MGIVSGGTAELFIGGVKVGFASEITVRTTPDGPPVEFKTNPIAVIDCALIYEGGLRDLSILPPPTRRQRCKRGYPHVLSTVRRYSALLSLGLEVETHAVRHALWVTPTKRSKQRSLAARWGRALRQINKDYQP